MRDSKPESRDHEADQWSRYSAEARKRQDMFMSEAQQVTAARPAQKAVAQRDYRCATAESSGSPLFP
ncbi:hypothetical protein PCASD_05538 [Puccinia coronata f. sp. avenae]|uniref:Uncharacterized protein n=1 Tax=Puccinia coronata f. sp. avenae TaxID=200324 RepID=A0A2N5UVW9_9BASI|nr:hypothetical protein PCASD_05538 [Puccinia coronata f. sp. avenae]